VRLQPGSPCSFKRVKLKAGAYATPWTATPIEIKELRCQRYYQRLAASGGAPAVLGILGQRVATNAIEIAITLPVRMRGNPVIATSNFAWANASPVGNQVAFYNNASASWAALLGALRVTTSRSSAPSCVILRLQVGARSEASPGASGNFTWELRPPSRSMRNCNNEYDSIALRRGRRFRAPA